MKKIPLTRGRFALVDDEDYEELSRHAWWCDGKGYAVRSVYFNGKRSHVERMHRRLLNCPDGKQVDHINHIKNDNQKINIRICNSNQNIMNQKIRCDNTSGYRGVYKKAFRKKWRWHARIGINKRRISLGYFKNAEDAAIAYDKAAKKYHGEFARLNFPD